MHTRTTLPGTEEKAWGSQTFGAAAAAKSLHSCPTLCDPIDGSPPGSPVSWDSPGKNTGESNFTQISKTY